MRVYLDNAATTPLDPQVLEAMKPFMLDHFGNPSSIHSHGREVRAAIERARKQIAELLNTSPSEIFFTSGGTEADNMAIKCAIETYQLKNAISSPIEHPAVLHTLEGLEKRGIIQLHKVDLDKSGGVSLESLNSLLTKHPGSLVSLMHGNNEIGNITNIQQVAEICNEHGAYFHSDTVQTIGHFDHDLESLQAHTIVGSAHKFHGPKGVGFLYVNNKHKIHPFITGGAQERNMRGGTENVYGIIGLAKALEVATLGRDKHESLIRSLKKRMIQKLEQSIPGIRFHGDSAQEECLYTVLNLDLPPTDDNEMLLFNLDINQISASGGSACASGSSLGSHVLQALNRKGDRGAIRFSFSKYNQPEEIDYVVEKLAAFYAVKA